MNVALLVSHSGGGVDPCSQSCWQDEYEPCPTNNTDVQGQDRCPVNFKRNVGKIVHLWVERQEVRGILQEHKSYCKQVAYYHSDAYKPQGCEHKYAAHLCPRRSESPEYAYGRHTVEYYYEKA